MHLNHVGKVGFQPPDLPHPNCTTVAQNGILSGKVPPSKSDLPQFWPRPSPILATTTPPPSLAFLFSGPMPPHLAEDVPNRIPLQRQGTGQLREGRFLCSDEIRKKAEFFLQRQSQDVTAEPSAAYIIDSQQEVLIVQHFPRTVYQFL